MLEAVLEVWPSQRVGVKTGPMMNELGLFKAVESTLPTSEYVYEKLNAYNLSHVFLMRQLAGLSGTPLLLWPATRWFITFERSITAS